MVVLARKQSNEDLKKQLKIQTSLLRGERAKAAALISSIGDGLIAIDNKGYIVEVNQVALNVLGFSRRELMGYWLPQKIIAVHEDDSVIDPLEQPFAQVFMTGRVISEKLYYRIKDGSKTPVDITCSPIFLKDKPIGAIEIFRDISAEIEADRLKSEFISLASHQLRTPLSTISLYSRMLIENYAGKLTKNQRELLNIVVASSSRMNRLLNTLLNITRIEGNNVSIDSRPTSIPRLIKELISGFMPVIKEKDIKFKSTIDKNILPVNTDRIIVGEIFNNLLSNAIKYTPEKGSITVSLYIKNGHIECSVKDTGYGIPRDSRNFIFTKFYRAKNIIEHDVTGTGLGLYFIKSLSSKVNGDVWFKSKENHGSTFYFSIPLAGIVTHRGKYKLELTN